MIRRAVGWLDQRTGAAPLVRAALRYVFPDHWTFLFGELALYAFVVLVATGVYLTFFFEPSLAETVYNGSYAPMRGRPMSEAYRSALDISFDVKAGLLMRQVHHWAALLFVMAIVIHMLRVVLTGAHRKPREVTYYVGVTLLVLALGEGYLGYSLADDLLSGMGLVIGYSVAMSIPLVGGPLALLVWGAEFPGSSDFLARLYIGHVLIIPVAIGALIGLHLTLLVVQHHTHFRGRGATERNVVGAPTWPGYVLQSGGLFVAVAAVLVLLGGLVQINPVWLWGPYDLAVGSNGAQPDWYLGWLIGALRLMPNWEPSIGGVTILPNPFIGGVVFPTIVIGILYLWPVLERRLSGDGATHHLLDRPRDAPVRTGLVVAMTTWVAVVFLAGAADRVMVQMGIPYSYQVWLWRVGFFAFPAIAFLLTRRVCEELRRTGVHPLRSTGGARVARGSGGGFTEAPEAREGPPSS